MTHELYYYNSAHLNIRRNLVNPLWVIWWSN